MILKTVPLLIKKQAFPSIIIEIEALHLVTQISLQGNYIKTVISISKESDNLIIIF